MKEVDFLQSAVNLLLTVPVWAVIGYFAVRSSSKRDKFEDNASDLLHSLDKRMAILEKENDFNKVVYRNIIDLAENVNKNSKDLNLYYARLKALEDGQSKNSSL